MGSPYDRYGIHEREQRRHHKINVGLHTIGVPIPKMLLLVLKQMYDTIKKEKKKSVR